MEWLSQVEDIFGLGYAITAKLSWNRFVLGEILWLETPDLHYLWTQALMHQICINKFAQVFLNLVDTWTHTHTVSRRLTAQLDTHAHTCMQSLSLFYKLTHSIRYCDNQSPRMYPGLVMSWTYQCVVRSVCLLKCMSSTITKKSFFMGCSVGSTSNWL